MSSMISSKQRPQRRRPAHGANNNGASRQRQNGSSSGNARRNYDRYVALAREAALAGDSVEMENCYQHAEHYFRVMKESRE